MKTVKKLSSVFLAALIIISAVPLAGFSLVLRAKALDSIGTFDYMQTYSFDEETGTLTLSGQYDIYDFDEGTSPFYGCTQIQKVIIEEGFTSIGDRLFENCTGITSITIPSSVTRIGDSAFINCNNITDIYVSWLEYFPPANFEYTVYQNASLHILKSTKYFCMEFPEWSIFNNIIEDAPGESTQGVTEYMNDTVYYRYAPFLGMLVIGGTGDMPDYGYRGEYDYGPGPKSPFFENDIINRIIIEDGITSVGDCTFVNCYNVTSITFPDSLTSIGRYAFEGCWLLPELTLPDNITSVDEGAFRSCHSYTSLTIPQKLTNIGPGAFSWCSSVANITVDANNPAFNSRNNCNAIIETATNALVCGCSTTIIPDGVTSLADFAFGGCACLESLTIPDSVTSIGSETFEECFRLSEITIPDSVISIGGEAFYKCDNLKEVIIPDSVTSMGAAVFAYCTSLENVKLSENLPGIDSSFFYGCTRLTSITIPTSVMYIDSGAFGACSSLIDIFVSWRNNFALTYDSFGYDVLKNATLHVPKGKAEAYKAADGWKKFEHILEALEPEYNPFLEYRFTADDNKTIIITRCDKSASGEIDIPDILYGFDVIGIDDYAFYHCQDITSIKIPFDLQSIGAHAFDDCPKLTEITFEKGIVIGSGNDRLTTNIIDIGDSAFSNCTSLVNIEIPDTVKSIGDSAFSNTDLVEIEIPSSVKNFGNCVFRDCSNLMDVKLPFGLVKIGEGLFCGCLSLWNVDIPGSITLIGDAAFENCRSLERITIPDGVTRVGDYSFYNCINLRSIEIPDEVTRIGSYAFGACTGLVSVKIGNNVTRIGNSAFKGCTALTSITIPDRVTSIGELAFGDCQGIKRITISDSVTTIQDKAFYGCGNLENVYYIGTNNQWRIMNIGKGNEALLNAEIEFITTTDEPLSEDSALDLNSDDGGKMTISGFAPGATVNDLMKMTADGWTASVETADGSDRIGTGSVITLTSDTGETVECTAVVYGDTNGDAWYDGTDSLIVNCISNGLLSEAQLGEAVYTAADCNHDDVIDGSDVAILEQAGLILANIDQSKTPEELFEDAAYSEYINLIDQTPVTAEKAAEDAIDTTPADEPAVTKNLIQKIIDFIIYIFKMITSNISKVF